VPKPNTNCVRLFEERGADPSRPESLSPASLPGVLRAFRQVTGWSLQYQPGPDSSQPTGLRWSAPVNPGVGATLRHLRLEPVGKDGDGSPPTIDAKAVRHLASALEDLVGEFQQTRHALWQREAELAAGVPLVPQPDETQHLAARLQAVLKGGAQAVGCEGAALYLLDEATTVLKLRSCWGLPQDRLLEPARPLQGALADLEAMLGHAVVLEDTALQQHWNAPEDFPAAVCVPVSTPTTILGTLWMFSQTSRDFTDSQTNILETVAGRLAADLEREMLLGEAMAASRWKRELAAVERIQRNQLPTVSPQLEGWDVAGWSPVLESVDGQFFDWFTLPSGLLALAVGNAQAEGLEAAFSATVLKAALRSHGQYHRDPAPLLKQINLTLWTGSAGDQFASLFCGLLETASGQLRFAAAGQIGSLLIQSDQCRSLTHPSPLLGAGPEVVLSHREQHLQPGSLLLLYSIPKPLDGNEPSRLGDETPLRTLLTDHKNRPAKELATLVRGYWRSLPTGREGANRAILIVKRGNV